MELGKLANLEYGFTDSAKKSGTARFIRITDIDESGNLKKTEQTFVSLTEKSKKYLLKTRDVLVARTGATYGKTVVFKETYPAVFASYLIRLNFDHKKIDPDFYWFFAQSEEYWKQAKNLVTGGAQPQFNGNVLKKIKILLPDLATQKHLVAEMEEQEAVIESNKKLIGIMEQKISDLLSKI